MKSKIGGRVRAALMAAVATFAITLAAPASAQIYFLEQGSFGVRLNAVAAELQANQQIS